MSELPLWRQPQTLDLARSLGPWLALPLVALIIIFGLVRPAMRAARSTSPRLLSATVQDAISLPPADGGNGARVSVGDPGGPALLPTAQAARLQTRSAQVESIRQLAKHDPATVANVVRNWANQPT